ncbi:MAG: glucose PTS transporter subunit IIA, partial [Lachnospiraceae bacterium]
VPHVYDEIMRHLGTKVEEKKEKREKVNLLNSFISIITGAFSPFLGVLCACGILKGILSLCTAAGILLPDSSTYNILYSLGDAAFYFLPVILGLTASRKFGLPELEGMIIALALVYPNVLAASGNTLNELFGIPVRMPASGDYTGSVVPIILAVAFAGWFEKHYKKYIPDTIKLFAVPLITTIVTISLTFWIIGPVASMLADGIAAVFQALNNISPVVMGFAVGFLWQVLVIFGLHWALVPVALVNMTQGGDIILSAMFGTTFAQTGAVLAIWFRTRDEKIRGLCPAAAISAVAGVTEPAIYGITLPKKSTFVRTCIIAGIGGAAMLALDVRQYMLAGFGVFGYTAFINPMTNHTGKVIYAIIISIACLAAAFVAELVFYREKSGGTGEVIFAPVKGRLKPLKAVRDEAFAGGELGQGVAIEPSEGKVYAPADGVLSSFFSTGHAFGITTASGAEILIHVGMDTVNLNGEGFRPQKNQGEAVKKGELLLEFDIELLKKRGFITDTPIVVTNSDVFGKIETERSKNVTVGQQIFVIK